MSPPEFRPNTITYTDLSHKLQKQIDASIAPHRTDRALILFVHRFIVQIAHRITDVPLAEAEQKLSQLIISYAQYLPQLIAEFDQGCRHSGWQDVSIRCQHIIESYFERTSGRDVDNSILGLMDKIYFSHRLIEELHDHLLFHRAAPALQWNMTATNLLVHQILGSQFASRLDMSAIELSEQLLKLALPDRPNHQAPMSEPLSWPCFSAHHGVDFAV